MLRQRIIPCLLLSENSLVKTLEFKDPKYLGDPLNAVRIFNDKEIDELIILDIEASKLNREPNYKLISRIAKECKSPITYGGGIKNVKQAEKIISLGVERVSLCSAIKNNFKLIKELSSEFGSQSIVVVLEVFKSKVSNTSYQINNCNQKINPLTFSKKVEDFGAGEIIISCINKDGTRSGYDIDLIKLFKLNCSIPITALGGADNINDIKMLFNSLGIVGAAAGSMFTLTGKYRSLLIQYPTKDEKKLIYPK